MFVLSVSNVILQIHLSFSSPEAKKIPSANSHALICFVLRVKSRHGVIDFVEQDGQR